MLDAPKMNRPFQKSFSSCITQFIKIRNVLTDDTAVLELNGLSYITGSGIHTRTKHNKAMQQVKTEILSPYLCPPEHLFGYTGSR